MSLFLSQGREWLDTGRAASGHGASRLIAVSELAATHDRYSRAEVPVGHTRTVVEGSSFGGGSGPASHGRWGEAEGWRAAAYLVKKGLALPPSGV